MDHLWTQNHNLWIFFSNHGDHFVLFDFQCFAIQNFWLYTPLLTRVCGPVGVHLIWRDVMAVGGPGTEHGGYE